MYKNFDIDGFITEAETRIIAEDREEYRPYLLAAFEFANKMKLVADRCLTGCNALPLKVGEYRLTFYTSANLVDISKEMGDYIRDAVNRADVAAGGRKASFPADYLQVVFMIPYKEHIIKVNGRDLIALNYFKKHFGFDVLYDGGTAIDEQYDADGRIMSKVGQNGARILPAEIALIDSLHVLYDYGPYGQAKWVENFARLVPLFNQIVCKDFGRIAKELRICGGKDNNDIITKLLAAQMDDMILVGNYGILKMLEARTRDGGEEDEDGDYSIFGGKSGKNKKNERRGQKPERNDNNGGSNKAANPVEYLRESLRGSRLQFISGKSAETIRADFADLTGEAVKFVDYPVYVPNDFQLHKYTFFIGGENQRLNTGGDKIAIDVYNSAAYELIPVRMCGAVVGNPFILLRFKLIDLWSIKVLNMSKNINFDKSLFERYIRIVRILLDVIEEDWREKPFELFQIENVWGAWKNEKIAKNMLKADTFRMGDYFII
jgi:hypothetical protein